MLSDFAAHTVFASVSYAFAIALFVRWHVMRSPPQSPLRSSHAVLAACVGFAILGTAIAMDGLGFYWLRDLRWWAWLGLLGGLALFGIAWIYSAPIHVDPSVYNLSKLERLRASVKKVREEWMKFPNGAQDSERRAMYGELEAAGEDFTSDAKIGALIRAILADASHMLTMGDRRFAVMHGGQNQIDRLSECNQRLQQAAIDLLEKTKPDVIYGVGAVGTEVGSVNRQQHLNQIARLREQISRLRIEMETAKGVETTPDVWEDRYVLLQNSVAREIYAIADEAESSAYINHGNVHERTGGPPHQLYIDMCVRDLDYLLKFIHAYSRGRQT